MRRPARRVPIALRPAPPAGADAHGPRTCGVVVTWDGGEVLGRTIPAAVGTCDRVIVVDNGSARPTTDRLEALAQEHPTLEVVRLGRNRGLGAALAVAVEQVEEEWFLALDQDSLLLPWVGRRLRALAPRLPDDVALLAPSFAVWDGVHLPAELVGAAPADRPLDDVAVWVRPWLQLSGGLFRTAAVRAVGGFDEGFVVDVVDHDLDLRLRRAGHRLAQHTGVDLVHRPGRPTEHRWRGRSVRTSGRVPDRRYYQARDGLRLARASRGEYLRWLLPEMGADLGKALLFDGQRRATAWALGQGVADGLRGREGFRPRGGRRRRSSGPELEVPDLAAGGEVGRMADAPAGATPAITHEPDGDRFTLTADGELAQVTYVRGDGRVTITHTLVPPPLEGRGYGAALVAACVEWAAQEGLTVGSHCWFADRWFDRHPDQAARVGAA